MNHLISIGMQDTATVRFERHFHNRWEITYYYEGEGVNITGDKKFDFSPGTIICQAPHVPHEDISEHGYKNIYFLVDNFNLPYTTSVLFRDTASMDFLYILRQLYNEYHARGADHGRVTDALLNVLYQYLLDFTNDEHRDVFVESFTRTLIENLSNCEFSLTDELKKLPVCPNHFRRIFKKYTGRSPKEYMQDLRVSYSMQLLKNSTLPLKNICAMCGYEDPYYFSRLFKQHTGMAPAYWKAANPPEVD